MTFPCCGHKQVAPVGFQSRGILGLGLTILAITSLSAGRWWMNKKQSNVQMDVSPSSEVHDIVPVPAVQTKATEHHRTSTGAEFKNGAAAPEMEAGTEEEAAVKKDAATETNVTESDITEAVEKCLLEAKSYKYILSNRYKAPAHKLTKAHFAQEDGVYIPKIKQTLKFKSFTLEKDDILVSFEYINKRGWFGGASKAKVSELMTVGKYNWLEKLIRLQNESRLVRMKFVHKDGLRMTEAITVTNKRDFPFEFDEDQKNKLQTVDKKASLFPFFGKDVELVKFGTDTGIVHTNASDDTNWKPAYKKALGLCTEAAPMKMWFRGHNKDYEAPAKTTCTTRRRLFALSERFCRVREFQASTEM